VLVSIALMIKMWHLIRASDRGARVQLALDRYGEHYNMLSKKNIPTISLFYMREITMGKRAKK